MNKLFAVAAVLCVLLLSGCGGLPIQPIMDSKAFPTKDSAYVAGMFSRSWDDKKLGFGLGLVEVESDDEYVMPFDVTTDLPNSVKDRFVMIELPPGKYRIASWVTYSGGSALTQTNISPDSVTGMPFTLAPGEVAFIGSHVARSQRLSRSDDNYTWTVYHQRLSMKTVLKELPKSYPSFSNLPMSCPSCL